MSLGCMITYQVLIGISVSCFENSFIEIQFAYHKNHLFKVCMSLILVELQNCKYNTIEFFSLLFKTAKTV